MSKQEEQLLAPGQRWDDLSDPDSGERNREDVVGGAGGLATKAAAALAEYDPNDGLPPYAQEVGFGD